MKERIEKIRDEVKLDLENNNITTPKGVDLEISHHYGVDSFYKFGTCMCTLVNKDYCKKILYQFPGQTNPEHFHKIKFVLQDPPLGTGHAILSCLKDLQCDNKTIILSGDVPNIKASTLNECFYLNSIKIIEWPELVKTNLSNRLELNLNYSIKENERELSLEGQGKWKDININEL